MNSLRAVIVPRLAVAQFFCLWLAGCVGVQSLAAGEVPPPIRSEPSWDGSIESQIGYESNIYESDRHIEPITGSWFSESSLECGRSWQHGEDSHEFVVAAEYKTYFSTTSLEEYLLQPGLIWHEVFSESLSLDLDCQAAVLRARVDQDFVDEPDETEEAIGAETGFELIKKFPDKSILRWDGRIAGELFEYMQGSNVDCRTGLELEKPLGGDLVVRWGGSCEWQAYSHMTWSGRPTDEPPELNTIFCRAFAGLAGSWNPSWEWKLTVTGGPDFDIKGGYYNAWTLGLRARVICHIGRWRLAAKLDPETGIFTNRPAVLGRSSPTLIAQELWAGTEAAYEIFPGWEIFSTASWRWQWTNGGHSEDAALTSFDNFVVRTGLRVEF